LILVQNIPKTGANIMKLAIKHVASIPKNAFLLSGEWLRNKSLSMPAIVDERI